MRRSHFKEQWLPLCLVRATVLLGKSRRLEEAVEVAPWVVALCEFPGRLYRGKPPSPGSPLLLKQARPVGHLLPASGTCFLSPGGTAGTLCACLRDNGPCGSSLTGFWESEC